MMMRIWMFLLQLVGVFPLVAQQGTVSGVLVDARTRQPVSFATVTAYQQADTAVMGYRLSDDAGKFSLQRVPAGVPGYVVVAFTGYRIERRTFVVSPEKTDIQLDTFFLTPDTLTLEAVLIAAERPPVVFRNDTIEFNAASFKTMPSAVVEDLLRKLPGVAVDKDGNITVNGQQVSKVMVDGKEFFGGDPQTATRNLSADMIEKVQVTEDKQQRDANPMAVSSEIGVVLNLTLKKAIKKGWFGKGYAGGGYSNANAANPWEAGALANLYRDTVQISLLGSANNLNRPGFSRQELSGAGGFGGRGSTGAAGAGGNGGITTSRNIGINFNYTPVKVLEFNLRYTLGTTRETGASDYLRTQLLGDTTLLSGQQNRSRTDQLRHSAGIQVAWKPDTLTKISFSPSFSWNGSRDTTSGTSSLSRVSPAGSEPLNAYHSTLGSETTAWQTGARLWGSHKFRRPKQQLSFDLSGSGGASAGGTLSQSTGTLLGNIPAVIDQWRRHTTRSLSGSGSISYQHPLGKMLTGTLSLNNQTSLSGDTVATYVPSVPGEHPYRQPVDSLTNALSQLVVSSTLNAAVVWEKGSKKQRISVQPAIGLRWLYYQNRYQDGTRFEKPYINPVPSLSVKYRDFRVNYSFQLEGISLNDLRPVTDYTRPSNIMEGNPSLQPPQAHRFEVNYFKANREKGLNNSFWISGGLRQRAVVYERIVDAEGNQLSRPVNANGVKNLQARSEHTIPLRLHDSLKCVLRGVLVGRVNQNVLIFNGVRTDPVRYSGDPAVGFDFDWANHVSLRPTYTFSWSLQDLDQAGKRNQQVIWHILEGEALVRFHPRLVWNATIGYRYTPTPATGFRQHNTLLNTSLAYLFLKENRGQLKLSVFDLLGQNQGVSRTLTEFGEINETSLVLQRYALLTFIYDLRLKGVDAQKKERRGND